MSPLPKLPPFGSFLGGGFECSSHRAWHGGQLDLRQATGHARFHATDYRALRHAGLRWARDGLVWAAIEPEPGRFRWQGWQAEIEAGAAAGIEICWDLLHFGLPGWLDPWSADFPRRAAELAAGAAALHRAAAGRPGLFCPINEISFWAYAGGERGWMTPLATGRGTAWKEQLLQAAIAMARAIRSTDAGARLLWCEPLIQVSPRDESQWQAARDQHAAQFEAHDRLLAEDSGRLADWLGFNFYPHNQRYADGTPIGFGTAAYRQLADLLHEVAARHPPMPLLIAETGAEGSARPAWLHYVAEESAIAAANGVEIQGICLYPVTDYPGWDDGRPCPTGLLGMADENGRRPVEPRYLAKVREIESRFRPPAAP